jgi:hypothetical protein
MRQKIGQMAADREKEQHEEKLRNLAQAAREERVGGRPVNDTEVGEHTFAFSDHGFRVFILAVHLGSQ